jgi:quinohemoprotein ethanol dehydrogenase
MDAATGELKWQFDPQILKEWDVKSCRGVQNRGVAVWQGHVYVGTIDGRLITLNADTGRWIRKPCDGNGCQYLDRGMVEVGRWRNRMGFFCL